MNHVMEKKFANMEKSCKDATEDATKWKRKANGLQTRLTEALESKKDVETSVKDLETKMMSANSEKEAVELERGSLKERNTELEAEVKKCKGALAEYFDNGFERARAQALHFYPEADLSGLDSFKIVVDGQLVDEE